MQSHPQFRSLIPTTNHADARNIPVALPFSREISMDDSASQMDDDTDMNSSMPGYGGVSGSHTLGGRSAARRLRGTRRTPVPANRTMTPLGLGANKPQPHQKPHPSYNHRGIDFLTKLPFDLAVRIIQDLDLRSFVRLSQVSRGWYLLAHRRDEWKRRMVERQWTLTIPSELGVSDDQIDWLYWFKHRYQLDRRWSLGKVTSHYLIGHTDCVYCVQFDDRKMITGSRDATIKVWDLSTYQCVKTLRGHEKSVLCLQYDEHILVTGSSDWTLAVWSMKTLEPLGVLKGHTERISDVCFDHRYIVSASKDTTIRVWDRNNGSLIRTIRGHHGPVNAVKLVGDRLISASGDALIKMWDIQTGECIREFTGHKKGIASLQFDGTTIVSGSQDKAIKVWNAESGDCIMTCYGHSDLVRAIDLSSEKIVSASYDRSIRVWNKSGTCVLKFDGVHEGCVLDVRFDMKRIVSTGQDKKILILDFSEGLDTRFFDR